MNKLVSIATAAALALAVSVSFATPSSADDAGAAIAGGVLGFMAGAAIAGTPHHHVYVDDGPRYEPHFRMRAHIRACFRAYGDDYDPDSNTYVDDYGYVRHCRL